MAHANAEFEELALATRADLSAVRVEIKALEAQVAELQPRERSESDVTVRRASLGPRAAPPFGPAAASAGAAAAGAAAPGAAAAAANAPAPAAAAAATPLPIFAPPAAAFEEGPFKDSASGRAAAATMRLALAVREAASRLPPAMTKEGKCASYLELFAGRAEVAATAAAACTVAFSAAKDAAAAAARALAPDGAGVASQSMRSLDKLVALAAVANAEAAQFASNHIENLYADVRRVCEKLERAEGVGQQHHVGGGNKATFDALKAQAEAVAGLATKSDLLAGSLVPAAWDEGQ